MRNIFIQQYIIYIFIPIVVQTEEIWLLVRAFKLI